METNILDPLALWGIQGMSREQAKALIAAAPELLAALDDCANALGEIFYPPDHHGRRVLDRANAVIAKATGGAQ